jgi:hypothetical protein
VVHPKAAMSRDTIRATPAPTRNRPLDQNVRNDQVPAMITDVPKLDPIEHKNWLAALYETGGITAEEIQYLYELLSYKGFNREIVLQQLNVVAKDKRIAMELIIAGALAGPQRGANIKLSNGKTAIEMGIPASGRQGQKALTLNKIVAATADLAAWFLKKMNVPKRIMIDLPGWLQFPSAGSIILPANLREQHIEFSKRFSKLIGGEFNEQIYMQMTSNAYLDPKLNLFG